MVTIMMIISENLNELASMRRSVKLSDGGGFLQAVEEALDSAYGSIYFNKETFVAISPKFEEKLLKDPKLAEETVQKIDDLARLGGKDSIIVIDRSGDISQYRTKPDERQRRAEHIEAEERKEALKARLHRKARVEAYFKIVKRNAIKRKLIEQENAKRPRKRYGISVSKLDSVARSILQLPTRVPDCEI